MSTAPTLEDPRTLTEREAIVLARLGDDRTLRQIAADLYVTRNTIKSQVRSVYRKLGVSSRAEAVQRARAAGLGGPAERGTPTGAARRHG
jgi:LuxR family transcriptional regulator of spore coat protein